MEKINLYDLDYEQLAQFLTEQGEAKFRAKQVWEWMYKHYALSFAELSNLSKSLRQKL